MERRLGKRHREQQVSHKVYIATPAYNGQVDTDYAISIAETAQLATGMDIGLTASVMGNGAFIEIARNSFVQMFLETDCTHLMFIDADLRWEARAVVGLVTSGRDVCAGVYRKREEPESYPVRHIEAEGGGLQIEDGGWIPCNRVATGFLCIARHVVEDMAKDARVWVSKGKIARSPRLFYTQEIETGTPNEYSFMGEDFSWCDDYVARYKKPIWVWPDFDFTHGGYKCNWQHFIKKQVEIAEKEHAEKQNGTG